MIISYEKLSINPGPYHFFFFENIQNVINRGIISKKNIVLGLEKIDILYNAVTPINRSAYFIIMFILFCFLFKLLHAKPSVEFLQKKVLLLAEISGERCFG